ncbi:zinc finger protein 839 isoform X2 [Rhinoderma darwinii]|uniref:zinc finger protein 839 isoform X2 n=1 Tax=Rhinoderma darwinii TaxID=43563 RepID=UPI003F67468F
MAALGCPGNMAAVASAVEPMGEYVQVVVGEDGDPSQVVVMQGGGGELLRSVQELTPEILQSISQTDTVFYVQADGSLVPGGSLEEVQSGVRLVTGGHMAEAAHHGVRLEETVKTGGHVMEVQSAVNLVTRGQGVEDAHPGVMLVPGAQIQETTHPGVSLVSGGQMVEAVQYGMRLLNGCPVLEEEAVHSGMDVVSDLDEEAAYPDMMTALNLTKEAARAETATPEASLVPARAETATPEASLVPARAPEMATHDVMQSQPLPANSTGPNLKDGAQQQVKSIHVQAPVPQTKKSADPGVLNLSAVHMKSTGPSLLGAQVVQIKSLSESGQPLVVNASSPIQILVRQAQLSAAKPRTQDVNKNAGEPLEEHRSCVAHPQNGAHASCTADHAQKKGQKRKKPVKIKTRSGRISRPPKHKAKDYKFLKVGDLIQGSTSDSGDFSELSTDEDEKGAKENPPCDLRPQTVKNTLFQCQTCEKSYMGKGGLSRHYRLYPTHGQMEPPSVCDAKKHGEAGAGGHSLPSEPKKPTPRPRKRLLEDPLNPSQPSLPTMVRDGLEFVPVTAACRGQQQMTGRRFGRPRKILAIASSEQNALTAKELIQKCEVADLKDHVAPCLSERLSVYDFLLLKVKQENPDDPLFPHLYKELEKLHSMLRILAQEYFSNGAAGKTLEVADCKVAASLGVSEEMIVKASPPTTSPATEEQKLQSEEENECSVEELMPPSKRLRLDDPKCVTTENAPGSHEAEQRAGRMSTGDQLSCGNDTSSDVTINNCTEQVIETSHPNVMEEEAAAVQLHTSPDPESLSCEVGRSAGSAASGDSTQICEHPEENSSDTIQIAVIQEGTDAEVSPDSATEQLPCAAASLADSALPSDAPPTTMAGETCSESFQGVDPLIPPDAVAGDQCTHAFGFHHGHDLVFVHSSEETSTGEAVVIYDSTASPADVPLDTVVPLVEMK